MSTVQQFVTTDAEARQVSPSSNYAILSRLGIRGTGSSHQRIAYLYPGKVPFVAGSVINSATLTIYVAAGGSGSNSFTCKRVTTKWRETTLTYNTQPTVSGTHVATKSVTSPAQGDAVTFNVKAMLQDVANGGTSGTFFGFQITISQDHDITIYSGEAADPTYVATLDVDWTEAPLQPDGLSPDGAAVGVQYPYLSWPNGFHDKAGDVTQGWARIQISANAADMPSTSDGTPDFDTTQFALSDASWDSSDASTGGGAWAGIAGGATKYWRVMLWDGSGLPSPWSEVATFTRQNLGTLTVDSPGATVAETTPPIVWTLTGATQQRYKVTLYSVTSSKVTRLTDAKADTNSSTTSVTFPSNLIKKGTTYRVRVEVWDDVERVAAGYDDHLTTDQDFTYVQDLTPNQVDTATVSRYINANGESTPAIQVDFSRASAPDFFCLTLSTDGGATWVEEQDRVSVADCHVSGDNYRLIYWGLKPHVNYEVGVEAVVLDTGKFRHSATRDAGAIRTAFTGIWLVDSENIISGATPGINVCIYGTDSADLTVGETATTYDLVGAQVPVRIVDVIRGYEGSISGTLIRASDRTHFYTLRGRADTLRLILADLNIPVHIEEGHVVPTPVPGDTMYSVSFTCFQVGGPWPVVTP